MPDLPSTNLNAASANASPVADAPASALERLAQMHEAEAFGLMVTLMRDPEVKPEHRMRAAETIMERARGKAKTQTAVPPKAKNVVSLSEAALLELVRQASLPRLQVRAEPINVTPKNEFLDDDEADEDGDEE